MPPLATRHRVQAQPRDDARHRLAECIAALDRRLRRQVGVDRYRQYRVLDSEMGQRDADRVVDLGRAGEGGVETLAVQFPHDLETGFAGPPPVKRAPGETAAGAAA